MEGKILLVDNSYVCTSVGYCIYQYLTERVDKKKLGIILDEKYDRYSKKTFTRRLLRAEITALYVLADDSFIAIAKKGIFHKESGERVFRKVFAIPRGSKPLNLCFLPNGNIYFGEYFQNMEKDAVNIYGSRDYGKTWQVVYRFPKDYINHVHGLFFDPYTERMWVLTGDRENECIIGYTENEFNSFHEVLRGGQEFRSCQLFFYKDFIVYATDSQYIQNEIRAINRNTLKISVLAKIQGSAIKGGQTENVSYLSTTIEPSKVNKDRFSHIWVTKDGEHWQDVYKAEKDCWPSIFQFGTFEFPQNAYCDGKLWFSGRALKGFDGKSSYINI